MEVVPVCAQPEQRASTSNESEANEVFMMPPRKAMNLRRPAPAHPISALPATLSDDSDLARLDGSDHTPHLRQNHQSSSESTSETSSDVISGK
jgi:hypothetical protein